MSLPPTRPGELSASPSGATFPYIPELEMEDGLAVPFLRNDPNDPWFFPPSHPFSQSGPFHPRFVSGESSFAGSSSFPSAAPPPPPSYPPWSNLLPDNIGTSTSSSIPGPSEPSVYAAGGANGQSAVATGSQSVFPHEQPNVRAIFPYMPVPSPTSGQAIPASPYPNHVELWESACRDAVVVNGPRIFVPQTMYQPHSQGDKERYVSLAKLQSPITFLKQDSLEWGIPLQPLLSKQPIQLLGGDEPAFTSCGPSICIRVQWPGYQPFHKQVSTKDYTSKRSMISKERLARLAAKCVMQYMDTISVQAMQAGSDSQWRVGPFSIRVDDIILVSLHHVSKGSWQPHLRLRRTIGTAIVSSPDRRSIAGPSTEIYR